MWFRNIFRRAKEAGAQTDESQEPAGHLPAQALHQLNRVQLQAGRDLPGVTAGLRSSRRRRPAHDFREHRIYVPGDDIRHIDWKASARQEHTFIRQGEHPRDITISLLLDCSASMGWGEPPKSQKMFEIAATLSYVALSQSDRLIVAPFGTESPQPLGPIRGKGQVPVVLNYLRGLTCAGRIDLAQSVRSFKRQARNGLILLLSDLLDVEQLGMVLEQLPRPTWNVVVVHLLHPDELAPPVRGDFEMVDVETGKKANYDLNSAALAAYGERVNAWRNDLEMHCTEHSAHYVHIPTDWSLSRQVIPHLRLLQILMPL